MGVSSGVKVLGTCHFEKKIVAIIACHYLKNGTPYSVPLTIITLFQVHTYDNATFLLVHKINVYLVTPCTFPLC